MNKTEGRLLLLLFLISSFTVYSQREANIWYFGSKAGLDFNSGTPQSLLNSRLDCQSSTASISTPNGRLLFYTDGYTIYDSTHNKMPNSKDERYNGNLITNQAALIVPQPDSAHIYYLFSTEANTYNGYGSNFLHYSVINMHLNSGKGDVEPGKRRIPLLSSSGMRLTGAKHGNGKDYWILSSKLYSYLDSTGNVRFSDSIYAWKLSSSGLSNPVITKTNLRDNGIGQGFMKTAVNGKKIAYSRSFQDTFLFADFNDSTGTLKNIWIIKHKYVFSLEFSQSGNYLYVSDGGLGTRKLYQYNALANSKSEFIQSKKLIDSTSANGTFPLQLGPDGKIYVDEIKKGYLHIIHAPDSQGVQCRYRKNAVYLSGRLAQFGLPNFVPVFLKKYFPMIDIKIGCLGDSSYFSIKEYNYLDSVRWDFGDPSSGALNFSMKPNKTTHVYLKTGIYNIKLTLYYPAKIDSLKQNLTVIVPISGFNASDVCETDSLHFSNTSQPKNNLQFKWKFGDGKISSLDSPIHIFPVSGITKTYNVTLVATLNGKCSDSITKGVTVNANPVSDFTYTLNSSRLDLKASQANNSAYRWKFGTSDSVVTSVITYSYNITKPNQYYVCLRVNNISGCSSETCKTILTGISSIHKIDDVTIYPNPNNGKFVINIQNPTNEVRIDIYNLLGEKIKTLQTVPFKSSYETDLDVANGIYFVSVKNGEYIFNQKLFVNEGNIK